MKKRKKINPDMKTGAVMDNWYVYMIECSDGTIYTGITNDVKARILKHNSGKGAKYTRARRPVKLKAQWKCSTKSASAQAEYALKKLSRAHKLKLINKLKVSDKRNIFTKTL